MKNGAEYNRYEHLYDMLQNELQVTLNLVVSQCGNSELAESSCIL